MARAPGKDCKVCGSPRQAEIDARLAKGETSRAIARWLSASGEDMSHAAVARHAKNHLTRRAAQKAARAARKPAGVPAAALREVLPPGPVQTPEIVDENPVVEAMAIEIGEAAKALDAIASEALSVARVVGAELKAFDADDLGVKRWRGATLAMANLFTGALKTATEAIVARDEILGGGKKLKVDVDAKVSGGLAGLFAELEKQEAAHGGADSS